MAKKAKVSILKRINEILLSGFVPVLRREESYNDSGFAYALAIGTSLDGKKVFVQNSDYETIEDAKDNMDTDGFEPQSETDLSDFELVSAFISEIQEKFEDETWSAGDLAFVVDHDDLDENIGVGLRKIEESQSDSHDDVRVYNADKSDWHYVNKKYLCPGFDGMSSGEHIEIDGKKYDKGEILERIKELKPIS